MEKYEELEESVIIEIKQFIHEKWEKESLSNIFPNIILRGDILQILAHYCTVIYFPLKGEGNNGFHISDVPAKNEETFNFVYINTQQTIEKQIYTAAHELGHQWKVDRAVCEVCGIDSNETIKEKIVNRFAAELLMPENMFREQYNNALSRYKKKSETISFTGFLKLVAFLMNFFLAPMKAVMYRLVEIRVISSDTINLFASDVEGNISDIVRQNIDRIIKQEGYVELYRPTKIKLIDGLAEMLEMAEEQQTVSEDKIENMRKKFGIERVSNEVPSAQINLINA